MDIIMINMPPFYALLSVVFKIPDMAFIFHFPFIYEQKILFLLYQTVQSSFSFIFVTLIHFLFTTV